MLQNGSIRIKDKITNGKIKMESGMDCVLPNSLQAQYAKDFVKVLKNAIKNPDSCLFLNAYRYQLDQLDYNDIIKRCENIANHVKMHEQFQEEPIIILLVHEAKDNPCSERKPIQEWFASHGKKVTEWESKNFN